MGRFHRSGFLRVNASKQSVDIARSHIGRGSAETIKSSTCMNRDEVGERGVGMPVEAVRRVRRRADKTFNVAAQLLPIRRSSGADMGVSARGLWTSRVVWTSPC